MKRVGDCPLCRCEVYLPDELFSAAMKSSMITFFCSYGHKQHFSEDTIKRHSAKITQPPAPLPSYDGTNIIKFKGKGHETQSHS